MRIDFEISFIEEAVFWRLQSVDETVSRRLVFHEEKNRIYELAGPLREETFRAFYRDWFKRLGLADVFENLLKGFPLIAQSGIPVLGRRVFGVKEEGVELYGGERGKKILIKLAAPRMQDMARLNTFLKNELMHVSDILDPDFAYDPDALVGGASDTETELIRSRFALLWDIYAAARLCRQGMPEFAPERSRDQFEKVFSFWNAEKKTRVFQQLTDPGKLQQRNLLVWSRDRDVETPGPHPFRCFLCGFLSFRATDCGEPSAASVIARIRRERKDWDPRMSICEHCFEIYRARKEVFV